MHERENALKEWLITTIKEQEFTLAPLAGDASFRRYYRMHANGTSYVIMDAPPGKEDLMPFIHVAQTLSQVGVPTPQIIAKDLTQGFLLLSDLGDDLLLDSLNAETVEKHYQHAMHTIHQMQSSSLAGLPAFDHAFMMAEMKHCIDWFFNAYLQLTLHADELVMVQNSMNFIAGEVAKQPITFIHRDYHSRNLMLLGAEANLGVIDFQDAMRGPLTYDLVSLLKDCYISWPRNKVLQWVGDFYEQNDLAQDYQLADFIRAFDFCGLQRHLKVLGIFCRLYLRDGKAGYLKDLPLTLKYVLECTETYEELHPLFHFFQTRVELP